MGQAGLRTAQGAGQGLETLLARRLLDRRQQLDEQQFAETQRRATAEEDFRNRQLEEQSKLRLAQQEETNRQHAEAESIKRVNIAMMRPIGSDVTPEEMQTETKAGVPSGMYDWTPGNLGMSSPEGEIGPTPTRIRWQGKEADKQKQAAQDQKDRYNDELIHQRELDRQARIGIAQLQSMKPGPMRLSSINVDGKDIQVAVISDGQGGVTTIPVGATQLPAGMKKENADLGNMVDQLDTLIGAGDKMKWPGIGFMTSPVQTGIKVITGKGSDEADQLRIMLDSIQAEVAHEKYGSALTPGEKQMLRKFAPSSNMHPNAVRNRLQVMRNILSNRSAQLKAGIPTTPITPDMLTDRPSLGTTMQPGAGGGMAFPLPGQGNKADPLGIR